MPVVYEQAESPPGVAGFTGILSCPFPYGPSPVVGNHKNRRRQQMDILRILISIILPPLGVFLKIGIGLHFWINILLTLLGYVPGIVHAIWVHVKK
jgi:uncharacterized membrane protein YqaE (UPF0057 family)